MDEKIKNEILAKNKKLIDMVIERAKRDFPDDIAIIGLTGSFSTNDYHEKSDLDLIIINNTNRGWEIGFCFILGDVGYDIFCTPYKPRLVALSTLESPYISCLVDLQILYCSKPGHMDEFNMYRQRALDELAKPIGKPCLQRAKKKIEMAKQEYAGVMLQDDIGAVRYAAGGVLFNAINAIVDINNDGTPELLLLTREEGHLFAIYTLNDNMPVRLWTGDRRGLAVMTADGILYFSELGDYLYTLQLEPGADRFTRLSSQRMEWELLWDTLDNLPNPMPLEFIPIAQ